MLYMVIETFRPGRKAEVYSRYEKRGRMLPGGLEYVSSWVEVDGDKCFQLMQADDAALFDVWFDQWSDLVDFEVVEVVASPTA